MKRSSAAPDVLAGAVLGALAAAPQHEGLRAQLGGQVDVAQHLGQRVAAHLAVVGRDRALLEHRVAEQVGGDHLDDQAGLGERLPEPLERRLAGRVVGHQVVVVEGDGGGAELGELVRRLDRVEQARDAGPKTSTPCQPTVQRPKLNLSSGRGV